MSRHLATIALALAGLLVPEVAGAHVSISSGPATANKSEKITFSVGHGCEGADTVGVRISIPAGITSVRALDSAFGRPAFETDVDGNVTAVSWRKPNEDALDADRAYYEVVIRVRVPDAPFTQVDFTVEQTCYSEAGGEVVVVWGDGGENDPATLTIVPARQSGWNSYTLPAAIVEDDVPVYFGDALIVWKGTAAYSPNPNIAALIATTMGVTALTGDLSAGDQLWVRY